MKDILWLEHSTQVQVKNDVSDVVYAASAPPPSVQL